MTNRARALRKHGRDRQQQKTWNNNNAIIFGIIEGSSGKGIRVRDIKKKMNLTGTTIYSYLRELEKEEAIEKYEKRYYSSRNFLKKRLEEED